MIDHTEIAKKLAESLDRRMLAGTADKRYLRQNIIIRKDLCMPSLKLAAMVAHASVTFICKRAKYESVFEGAGSRPAKSVFTPEQWQWMTELEPGLEYCDQLSFAKIVLAVNSLDELLEVERQAHEARLECHRVVDGGHSHNKPGDIACIAIGPDWPEKLFPVTGHLKTR